MGFFRKTPEEKAAQLRNLRQKRIAEEGKARLAKIEQSERKRIQKARSVQRKGSFSEKAAGFSKKAFGALGNIAQAKGAPRGKNKGRKVIRNAARRVAKNSQDNSFGSYGLDFGFFGPPKRKRK